MPSAPLPPRHRRVALSKRSVALVVVAIVLLPAAVIAAAVAIPSLIGSAMARPPSPGTTVLTPRDSKAAAAAASEQAGSAEQQAALYLSEQPTAYWLTPEADGLDAVANRVTGLAAEAREQHGALALVVYGLPGRDCGSQSAGGLSTDDEYAEWTGRIGQALGTARDVQKIVILEPDSLALAPECGNLDERATQLRTAVERIKDTNTWIYLDAGHSAWLPPSEMAALIRAVGVGDDVRGFVTNVSNYNSTDDEVEYAHELSRLLDGAHAIVDTSRNGVGPGSGWCNPPGRAVGEPGGTIGDGVVDTNLWIKPPGESDGTCNGGPPAGSWWPEAAVEVVRREE